MNMKITDVEAFHLRGPVVEREDSSMEALLVKVSTDAGIVGWGEVDGSRHVSKAAIDAPYSHPVAIGLRHLLLGENPLDIRRLWKKMFDGSIYFGREGAAIQAMAGVDIALWDILGKTLDTPIWQLLGGRFRDRLPLYASTLFGPTPQATVEIAKRVVDDGYSAMKFGWQGFGHGSEEDDVRTVEAIRGAVGMKPEVAIDVGFAWGTAKTAIRRARLMEPYRLLWIEEPLPPDDVQGYAKLAQATETPVAAGEEDASIRAYAALLEIGQIDYLQIDVTRTGLTMAMQVAAMAERLGVKCINHNFSNDFNTAASLHFLAAIPNAFIAEHCHQPSQLSRDIVKNPIQVVDGFALVPTEPGLGVEPNEEMIEKYIARAE